MLDEPSTSSPTSKHGDKPTTQYIPKTSLESEDYSPEPSDWGKDGNAKQFTREEEISQNYPIAQYDADHKEPFVVDYFQMGDFYIENLADCRNRLDEIDTFLKEKMEREGLKPTIGSYRMLLADIESGLNLTINHDRITRLNLVWYSLLPKIRQRKLNRKMGL